MCIFLIEMFTQIKYIYKKILPFWHANFIATARQKDREYVSSFLVCCVGRGIKNHMRKWGRTCGINSNLFTRGKGGVIYRPPT